jgi:hypothetical protein
MFEEDLIIRIVITIVGNSSDSGNCGNRSSIGVGGVKYATDGQSASSSWCRTALWAHDQNLHVP